MQKPTPNTETRRGLDLATEVRLLAKEAPDQWAARLLHRAATRMQVYYGYSLREKCDMVVKFMQTDEAGESVSRSELIERFQWRRQTVDEVIAALLEEMPQRIEAFEQQTSGPTVRGRRAMRYRLI